MDAGFSRMVKGFNGERCNFCNSTFRRPRHQSPASKGHPMPINLPLPSDDLPDMPESLGGTSQPPAERSPEYPGLPEADLAAAIARANASGFSVGSDPASLAKPKRSGRPPKQTADRFKIGLVREGENLNTILAAESGKVLRIPAKDYKDALRIRMRHYRAIKQFYDRGNDTASLVSISIEGGEAEGWSLKLYRQPEYKAILEDE